MRTNLACSLIGIALAACGPASRSNGGDDTNGDGANVCPVCSDDKTAINNCDGSTTPCNADQLCSNGECMSGCAAAEANHSSVGCEYYAVDMDAAMGPPKDACFTVFVANTSRAPVHIDAERAGVKLNLAAFAKLPVGSGQSITYAPYDPVAGLAPGKVAILFLAYAPGGGGPLMPNVACPVPAAVGTEAQIDGTGIGKAFRITTDLPVVAYQMLPYGGGAAAATGASLLLPTSAWGDNYVAVSAMDPDVAPPINVGGPSHNFVAKEDGTIVTMRPRSAVAGGNGVPSGVQGQPMTIMLNKGEYAQISQSAPLTGSPVSSNKPIGVFGGHQIMSIDRCCGDHGEQMIAPIRAVGSEYVAAPHGDRKPTPGEVRVYRIVGAVNETNLTYEPPNVGPAKVNLGQVLEIRTSEPFVVRSQDDGHPFMMFTYMTGAGEQGEGGWGDADFVRLVPPKQFLLHYVFFTDPTYPFTVLTVVRKKHNGKFEDVMLDCLGTVSGWTPTGSSGEYEITFVKLVDHFNGVAGCNNGVRTMDSKGQFGVWVWGWGSEDTNTGWVSYGYPAGEGVLPINDVIIQ
ncbi:MAG: IgGFc-binding protein [Deltaproteobacteria bacterium]|nr:IgGFc-binding protein [Deltaproteobacteria bacterium]MCW5807693.1 IgGFc-binding protein [Deltaproteobacteria bacterium]